MANRNSLAMSQSKDFKKWLVLNGWTLEKPVGVWERIRARKENRLFIAYQKTGAKVHYSVSDKDAQVVLDYLSYKRLIDVDPCLALKCNWRDPDLGCTCSDLEKWYQCPLEPEPTEEDFMTEAEFKERSRK